MERISRGGICSVEPISTVVRGTYDYTYGRNGNWALNRVYASSLGLDALVRRFDLLGQVERCVVVEVPVVVS
jgi:hypothetical protein